MSDTKISALPAASAVLAADECAVNEAGTSKKVTAAQVATYVGSTIMLPQRGGGTFYYCTPGSNTGAFTLVQNSLYAIPFYVPTTTTYVSIGVGGAIGAAVTLRLGIYSDNGAGVPGALVGDYGRVSGAAVGFHAISISQTLTPGWYWLACAGQGVSDSITCTSTTNRTPLPNADPYNTNTTAGYSQTGVTAALPDPWGATLTLAARVPFVWLAPQ